MATVLISKQPYYLKCMVHSYDHLYFTCFQFLYIMFEKHWQIIVFVNIMYAHNIVIPDQTMYKRQKFSSKTQNTCLVQDTEIGHTDFINACHISVFMQFDWLVNPMPLVKLCACVSRLLTNIISHCQQMWNFHSGGWCWSAASNNNNYLL